MIFYFFAQSGVVFTTFFPPRRHTSPPPRRCRARFSRHFRPHAVAFLFFVLIIFVTSRRAVSRARLSPIVPACSPALLFWSSRLLENAFIAVARARSRLSVKSSCAFPVHPVLFSSWRVPLAKRRSRDTTFVSHVSSQMYVSFVIHR